MFDSFIYFIKYFSLKNDEWHRKIQISFVFHKFFHLNKLHNCNSCLANEKSNFKRFLFYFANHNSMFHFFEKGTRHDDRSIGDQSVVARIKTAKNVKEIQVFLTFITCCLLQYTFFFVMQYVNSLFIRQLSLNCGYFKTLFFSKYSFFLLSFW